MEKLGRRSGSSTGKPASTGRKNRRLTPDNRIVHGLWIGTQLSKLELLTIVS
jgi:hypothetical protein